VRNIYLQRMGITSWRLCHRAQTSAYFQCLLHSDQNEPIGMIFADIDDAISLSDQQQLLQKIAQSVAPNIILHTMTCSPLTSAECDRVRYVILLGKQANQWVSQNAENNRFSVVRSVSLSALLKDPSHKKILWAQLKPLV